MSRLLLLALLSAACTKESANPNQWPKDTADPTVDDTGGDTDDTGQIVDTGLPDGVSPFTLSTSDGHSLTFDASTCQWPGWTTNFRQFWRVSDHSHVFVLVIEILGGFAGAGTYDNATSNARIRLQEEAGGSGAYYAADPAQGDTVNITIDAISDVDWTGWGTATASGLHSADGAAITLNPSTLPIWCEAIAH